MKSDISHNCHSRVGANPSLTVLIAIGIALAEMDSRLRGNDNTLHYPLMVVPLILRSVFYDEGSPWAIDGDPSAQKTRFRMTVEL